MADKLRPGIILVWVGLVLSIMAVILIHPPGPMGQTPGDVVLYIFTGPYSAFIIAGLTYLGIGLAGMGVIFAVWGFVVTLVHKTGAYILASVGLGFSVWAVIRALVLFVPHAH